MANPSQGSVPFFATLGFLAHLSPAEAAEQFGCRARLLEQELASLSAQLEALVPRLGEVLVIENEYARNHKVR